MIKHDLKLFWMFLVFSICSTNFGQVMIDPKHPDMVIEGGAALYEAGRIDYAMLVSDSQLIDDLELVPEQKAKLQRAMRESGMRNYKIMQEAVNSKNYDEARSLVNKEREEFTKFAKDVLLPHQLQVAEMLGVMKFVSELSVPQMITAPGFGIFADLSDEEKTRIEKAAAAIQRQLELDVNKLKFEALQKLVKELPKDKQKKLDSLLKAPLEELDRRTKFNSDN